MQLFRVSVEYSNFKTDLHSDLEVASSTASSRNRHKHLVLLFYLNKVCSLLFFLLSDQGARGGCTAQLCRKLWNLVIYVLLQGAEGNTNIFVPRHFIGFGSANQERYLTSQFGSANQESFITSQFGSANHEEPLTLLFWLYQSGEFYNLLVWFSQSGEFSNLLVLFLPIRRAI